MSTFHPKVTLVPQGLTSIAVTFKKQKREIRKKAGCSKTTSSLSSSFSSSSYWPLWDSSSTPCRTISSSFRGGGLLTRRRESKNSLAFLFNDELFSIIYDYDIDVTIYYSRPTTFGLYMLIYPFDNGRRYYRLVDDCICMLPLPHENNGCTRSLELTFFSVLNIFTALGYIGGLLDIRIISTT